MNNTINIKQIYLDALSKCNVSKWIDVNNAICDFVCSDNKIYTEEMLNELYASEPMELVRMFTRYGRNGDQSVKVEPNDLYVLNSDGYGAIGSYSNKDILELCEDTIVDLDNSDLLALFKDCQEFRETIEDDLVAAFNDLSLPKELIEVLDKYDINGYNKIGGPSSVDPISAFDDNRICIDCSFWSNLGEDVGCLFDIRTSDVLDSQNFAKEFCKEVKSYADDFDPEEHAKLWIEHRGENGVPDRIQDSLDDAYEIKEKLTDMSKDLDKAYERFIENSQKLTQVKGRGR